MRVVTSQGHGSRTGLWGALRRCWPVGALVVAGLVVLASPTLQALLVALIWASWALVALCALSSSARARGLGRRLLGWGHDLGGAVGGVVLVQARRLRVRVRGEVSAGERS